MSYVDSRGPLISKDNILNDDAILIFDLDGTILSINSFPHWVLFMLKGRFKDIGILNRAKLFAKTFTILALRKSGIIKHRRAKQHFQKSWNIALNHSKSCAALSIFTNQLQQSVRPNMLDCLALISDDKDNAILATAAAGEYAHELGLHLGFKHILTTPSYKDGLGKENVREEKCKRVIALLKSNKWENKKRIFFTDHEEDLALIKQSDITLWFGASNDITSIQQQAPNANIIACKDLSSAEILRAL